MENTEKSNDSDRAEPIKFKISQKSFEQIYNKYFIPLCRIANKIVGNKEVSEDIVQECFFILWKKRKTMEFETSFKAYILKSIRNKCFKHIEHNEVIRKHSEHIQRECVSNFYKSKDSNPLQILIKMETECEIKKAIEDLPAQCRETLMLWDEGLSYKEIAKKMGINIGTVKAQINRAKERCRKHLKS